MNTAFKHLDSKLRIADLTIRQWVGVLAGVLIALLYADLLHPFGTMGTMVTAVYIAGIPIAAVLVGGFSDFDIWLVLRSALRWRSTDGRYLPGPGVPTEGIPGARARGGSVLSRPGGAQRARPGRSVGAAMITRKRDIDLPHREAGDLLAVEAIDRSGVVITREGALVRILEVTPPNPFVMSADDRAQRPK